jgi:chromatin segregation and condensation protein Rec8/ScpA/Scc1 (kleisin family)
LGVKIVLVRTAPTAFHNVVVDDSAWMNERIFSLVSPKSPIFDSQNIWQKFLEISFLVFRDNFNTISRISTNDLFDKVPAHDETAADIRQLDPTIIEEPEDTQNVENEVFHEVQADLERTPDNPTISEVVVNEILNDEEEALTPSSTLVNKGQVAQLISNEYRLEFATVPAQLGLVNRREVALAFSHILTLEKEKQILATQEHFFGTIKLVSKPNNN